MYPEDGHVAHPRLYGAPAYARPPLSITPTALPLDPDDLPIAADQTPEERAIAEGLPVQPYRVAETPAVQRPELQPRPRPPLRSVLAERILGRAS